LQVVILQNGADLDELSSAYAITLLNPDFKILLPNSYELKVKKALDVFSEKFKDKIIKLNQLDISKITKAIITDNQTLDIILSEKYRSRDIRPPSKKSIFKKIQNSPL